MLALFLHSCMTSGKGFMSLCPSPVIYGNGFNKNSNLIVLSYELTKYVQPEIIQNAAWHISSTMEVFAIITIPVFERLNYLSCKFELPATPKASVALLVLEDARTHFQPGIWHFLEQCWRQSRAHRRSWSTGSLQSQECLTPRNAQRNLVYICPMLESITRMTQAKVKLTGGPGYGGEILQMGARPTEHTDSAVTFLTSWLESSPDSHLPELHGSAQSKCSK